MYSSTLDLWLPHIYRLKFQLTYFQIWGSSLYKNYFMPIKNEILQQGFAQGILIFPPSYYYDESILEPIDKDFSASSSV